MSDIRIVYGFCDDHCKYPVYTKEEVIGLLEYVIANNALPSDLIVDGVINNDTKLAAVNAIVEQNSGKAINLWVGTQAEYDAYTGDKRNLFAIISDDPTKKEIEATLSRHETSLLNTNLVVQNIVDGVTYVPNATNAVDSIKANTLNDSSSTTDAIVITVNNNGTTKTISFVY